MTDRLQTLVRGPRIRPGVHFRIRGISMRHSLLRSLFLAGLLAGPAAAYDGKPVTYSLTVADDVQTARVHADLWIEGNLLSLFNVMEIAGKPDGQAEFIENLQVADASGNRIAFKSLGAGDFELEHGGRVLVDYTVRLDHDQHRWPAGDEEVAYRTDEGLMAVGATLFLADGGETMQGPIEVTMALPAGWTAHTPWPKQGDHFVVASRRELLINAMFLGTAHAETFDVGGIAMTLVLGEQYVPAAPLFVDLLRTQLASYRAMFGADPLADRYLIVINDNPTGDGGAFASSFSQYIDGPADERNRVIWGHVMAHELLHFWNGLSLVPAEADEEWFKEGATDYLTIATMARNGLIDETLLFKRLENLPRRALMARYMQGLGMSVRAAGRDKAANRQLVYGGGSVAALALDIELRVRSGGEVGLPDLMRSLYAEFGKAGARYTYADIARHAQKLTGEDFGPFLAQVVDSEAYYDARPQLAAIGLRVDTFLDEFFVSREPDATDEQKARFEAVFGDG
jgi:predicted metalloprotease with PDZ domain